MAYLPLNLNDYIYIYIHFSLGTTLWKLWSKYRNRNLRGLGCHIFFTQISWKFIILYKSLNKAPLIFVDCLRHGPTFCFVIWNITSWRGPMKLAAGWQVGRQMPRAVSDLTQLFIPQLPLGRRRSWKVRWSFFKAYLRDIPPPRTQLSAPGFCYIFGLGEFRIWTFTFHCCWVGGRSNFWETCFCWSWTINSLPLIWREQFLEAIWSFFSPK